MATWYQIIKKGEHRGRYCPYCFNKANTTLVAWEYGGGNHYICIHCLRQFIKALSMLDKKINSDKEFKDIVDLMIYLGDSLKEMNECKKTATYICKQCSVDAPCLMVVTGVPVPPQHCPYHGVIDDPDWEVVE